MNFLCCLLTVVFFLTIAHANFTVPPNDDKVVCINYVNKNRKEAGLEEWKQDETLVASFEKKYNKNCPTEEQLKNGIDGFSVEKLQGGQSFVGMPKSLLVPGVKTFVCVGVDCVDKHDQFYAFVKKGAFSKIQNFFFAMIGTLAVYNFF